MKQFFTLVFTILSLSAAAQPLVWPWATALGGRAAINMEVDMAIDSQGNIIVVGNFEGTADFGSTTLTAIGFTDVYIAKMDSSGNVLWAIQGGEDMVFADGNGVAVDGNDNIIVCGRFAGNIIFGSDTAFGIGNRDIFLAKFDPTGAVQWVRADGGANLDAGYDVACDPLNNDIYVCGSYLQSATFGTFTLTSSSSTDENAFIAKYNSSGTAQWALGEGGNVEDRGVSLRVGTDNHVYMSGYFSGSASFDGGTVSSAGARDMFVAKYTKSGGGIWVKSGGGPGTDIAEGIGIDTAGNVYATGVFTATATFSGMSITEPNSLGAMFIVKYDRNGAIKWLKKGQPTTPSQVKGLAMYTDMNGYCYSSGFIGASSVFSGQSVPSAGGEDGYIAKYSPLGKLVWIINCGGTFNDRALTIEADQNGICTVAGIFINTANFGGNSLTAPLPTYRNFVTRIRGQNVGVGIEQLQQNDASISVFPNPVKAEMNYKYSTERNTQSVDMYIYDTKGKLILSESRVSASGTLSTEELPAGNYILELRDNGMPTSVIFTRE